MSTPFASGQTRSVPGSWPAESNGPGHPKATTSNALPASLRPAYHPPPSSQHQQHQSQHQKNIQDPQSLLHLQSQSQSQLQSQSQPQLQSQLQSQSQQHSQQQIIHNQTSSNSRSNSTQDRSQAPSRRPSGARTCAKCEKPLSGQFVRALDATYHLECFTCHECGNIVASKFFPVPDDGPNQYPLCEKDYFKRLDLICYQCGNALRGSYITALDRKYHIEHFTCSICPTVFGAQDSYYEHDGNVYCHYHYSTRFAQRCHGCHNAILKQFVEIFRNGQNQHWHPECYMIHKYWNVRLHSPDAPEAPAQNMPPSEDNASQDTRKTVRTEEERIENKVLWIWRSLSTFEERAATCISDMLLQVSNGAYFEGIMAARKFIVHVDLFFECADDLDQSLMIQTHRGLSYTREAKLLCKKVVSFFQLLSESQQSGRQRLGVTQELLSLVTGLAHYLKLLIRICLQGALKLERETGTPAGLNEFLEKINTLDERLAQDEVRDPIAESAPFVNRTSDACPVCQQPVEDKCARKADRVFHYPCLTCSRCHADLKEDLKEVMWSPSSAEVLCKRRDGPQVPDAEGGFIPVTRLQQYVHLLKVAHARLLATLRSVGAIPEHIANSRPNISGGPDSQSAGQRSQNRLSSSYEQALGDIRRLRSTRIERELSNAMKRARSSRIIDGPGGVVARPGSQEGSDDTPNNGNVQIVHEDSHRESHLMIGLNQMALDDIPRLLQAEVTKEFRPNAAKYAGDNLVGLEPRAKLLNGHRRDMSGGNELSKFDTQDFKYRSRRFFSELSAMEYVIVRPIAVLCMESLLGGSFTQQELLDLIENKRPTFWDRFGKAFKGEKKEKQKKGVFGKSLDSVVERDGAESTDGVGPGVLRVPAMLDAAVSAMRNMDMSVEGVFRKNGNIKRLREMQEEIDLKGCEGVDLSRENPVQVAALLKKFLRELPDPVCSFKLHKLFITAARIPDEERRRRVIHLTCCLLPKVHRDTMEVLLTFLKWAASFHTVDEESGSKMDTHNLATVIAPNILYSSPKNPDLDNTFLAVEAVHCLLKFNESMNEVPEDIVAILNDPSFTAGDGAIGPESLTTKEILKRYGDLRFSAVPQASPSTISSPSSARPYGGPTSAAMVQSHSQNGVRPSGQYQRQQDISDSWNSPGGVLSPPGPIGGAHYGRNSPANGSPFNGTPLATPPAIHTPDPMGSPGSRASARFNNGPSGIGAQ